MQSLIPRIPFPNKGPATPPESESAPEAPRAEALTTPILEQGLEQGLDQVREILFGEQWMSLDRRLQELDEVLRALVAEQIAAVERHLKHEVEAISERIGAEERSRGQGDSELLAKLGDSNRELDQKVGAFREKLENGQRTLRDQLLAQSHLLGDAIQQRHEEAQALVSRGLRDLESAKTDRMTLANLLMGVASRLKDDEQSDAPEA